MIATVNDELVGPIIWFGFWSVVLFALYLSELEKRRIGKSGHDESEYLRRNPTIIKRASSNKIVDNPTPLHEKNKG